MSERARAGLPLVSDNNATAARSVDADGQAVLVVTTKGAAPPEGLAATVTSGSWWVRVGSAQSWAAVALGFLRLAAVAAELGRRGVPLEALRRRRVSPVGVGVGAVAVLAVLAGQHAVAPAPAPMDVAGPVDDPAYVLTDDGNGSFRRPRPVPSEPLKGQNVPPCDTASHEVAIGGGCWVGPLAPPCGPKDYEHGGSCWRPSPKDPRVPVAVPPR